MKTNDKQPFYVCISGPFRILSVTGSSVCSPGSTDAQQFKDGMQALVTDLNSDSNKCSNLSNYPLQVYSASAELILQTWPLVIGGYNYELSGQGVKDIFVLKDSKWNRSGELNHARAAAASAMLNPSSILVSGGAHNKTKLDSTEIITFHSSGSLDQIKIGPKMPKASVGHCMVCISDHEVLFLGGKFGRETHIFNKWTSVWKQGPRMTESRYSFASGLLLTASGKR